MASRFRIFRKPIIASEEIVRTIILALHNFLKSHDDQLPVHLRTYAPANLVDHEHSERNFRPGTWRNEINCFGSFQEEGCYTCGSNHSADEIPRILSHYFIKEGAVSWPKKAGFTSKIKTILSFLLSL